MTDVVTITLVEQLGRLRARLTEAVKTWSPEAEFARFVFVTAGADVPFESPPMPSDLDAVRLGRAPLLAGIGYRLGGGVQPEVVAAWRSGFDRLKGTNPFPHDRISFAYRPTELLGLALGVVAIHDDGGAGWLRDVIRRRIDEERTSTWPGLLYALAAHEIGLSIPPPTVLGPNADVELPLIAFGRWWACRGDVPDPQNTLLLDQALLTRLTIADVSTTDLLAAALVLQAAEAAVKRRVAWYISSSEAGAAESTGPLGVLISVLRRFHIAVQQLQRRQRQRAPFEVNDEYDVQDLLHSVLKLHFDDVRPEEWTPSYGGHSSRMDFLLKPERIVVEVKMTRSGLGQKEVTQELAIDKDHYRAHPDCETLVCFVYDPDGRCANPAALVSDLSRTDDGFKVFVVVAPVGT